MDIFTIYSVCGIYRSSPDTRQGRLPHGRRFQPPLRRSQCSLGRASDWNSNLKPTLATGGRGKEPSLCLNKNLSLVSSLRPVRGR